MRKIDDKLMLQMLDEGKGQNEIAEYFKVSPAAISKRKKRLSKPDEYQLPESFKNLTEKEQRFVIAKLEDKTNIDAILSSHEVTTRQSAKSLGSALMKKPAVQEAISDIMENHGLTKDYRIKKLKDHVDNNDPNVSLKALDQSWKLDGSYAAEKRIHHVSSHALLIEAACRSDHSDNLDEEIIDAETMDDESS